MNKNLIYILLPVILALGVVAFFYRKDINLPRANPTKNTSNLVYTNNEFGFSFQYPNTYKIEERNLNSGNRYHKEIVLLTKDYVPPQDGEGPTTISIDIYQNNLDKQSIETWIKGNSFSNYKLGDGKLTSLDVDGKDALTYTWDGLYRGQTIVFENKGNIIAMSVTFLTPNDQILKDFDQVYNSFRVNDGSVNTKLPQTLVENYLKENISKISPEKEVLGGKFYLTEVKLLDNEKGVVSYEDGHVAFTADFNYSVSPEGQVTISNFKIRK